MLLEEDKEIDRLCRLMCGREPVINDAKPSSPIIYSQPTVKDVYYYIEMVIRLLPAASLFSLSLVLVLTVLFNWESDRKAVNHGVNSHTLIESKTDSITTKNRKDDVEAIKSTGVNRLIVSSEP